MLVAISVISITSFCYDINLIIDNSTKQDPYFPLRSSLDCDVIH
jgi:hypothetical protein